MIQKSKTVKTSYGSYEVFGEYNSSETETVEVFSCQDDCPNCSKNCGFGQHYLENSDYGIARWLLWLV